MGDMSELARSTCRLCLKSFQDLDIVDDSEKDIIQIVLPQIDLGHSDNLVICTECTEMLQQSFAFKSKCLEIEDSIHDFKNDKNVQVNLEEILGIREDRGSERIRICRTCLGYLENVFTELDKASKFKIVIQMCLPEMDIELTLNPVICEFCEELLKKIYDFIKQCIQNDEKIKFNSKQSDRLCLNDVVRYELDKDHSPRLECSETDIKDDCSTVKTENVVPKVQCMDSETNTNKLDKIYVISDTEGETVGTETTKKSDKTCTVQGKSKERRESTEMIIIDDSSSDEERLSRYSWKQSQKKKRKIEHDINGMIYCKYCYHATSNELALNEHISFCPKKPHFTEKTLVVNDIMSTKTRLGKELGNVKKNTTKYTAKVVNITKNTKKSVREPSSDNEVDIVDGPNRKKIVTSSCSLLIETKIVCNGEFPFTEEVYPLASKSTSITYLYLKGTKINFSMLKTKLNNEEEELENIKLAIENNKKKHLLELEILVCNHCTFNSRSNLKMALHYSSHSSNNKNKVDYANGYKSVFYCLNCTKMFRTKLCLRNHVDNCTTVPKDEVFLFKVGKVMHCTKCYFDSVDVKLVLQHLLRCGDINVKR